MGKSQNKETRKPRDDTKHLSRSPKNEGRINRAINQIESNQAHVRDIIEE